MDDTIFSIGKVHKNKTFKKILEDDPKYCVKFVKTYKNKRKNKNSYLSDIFIKYVISNLNINMDEINLNKYKKIIFDIETTGLPNKVWENNKFRYINPSNFDKYNNCLIVEISYIVLDENDNIVKKVSNLINRNNLVIENSNIHGITTEMCLNEGIKIEKFFEFFEKDIENIDILIAHNIEFDYTVLLSELYRFNQHNIINILKTKKLYCTMINGMNFINSRKYVKLIDLYKNFYKEDIIQKHRALDDVLMCYKCFLNIKNKIKFSIFNY